MAVISHLPPRSCPREGRLDLILAHRTLTRYPKQRSDNMTRPARTKRISVILPGQATESLRTASGRATCRLPGSPPRPRPFSGSTAVGVGWQGAAGSPGNVTSLRWQLNRQLDEIAGQPDSGGVGHSLSGRRPLATRRASILMRPALWSHRTEADR